MAESSCSARWGLKRKITLGISVAALFLYAAITIWLAFETNIGDKFLPSDKEFIYNNQIFTPSKDSEESNQNDNDHAEQNSKANISNSHWEYYSLLSSSLVEFKDYDISAESSQRFQKIPSQIPNISCFPLKLGYSDSQADELFNPWKSFDSCSDEKNQFLFFNSSNNKLEMNCTENPQYALGSLIETESFGSLLIQIKWNNYTSPVDIGQREFAYGKCGRQIQTFLVNKFNKKVADEAKEKSREINQFLARRKPHRPLTVFYILIDSLSRLHLYRNLPLFIDFLNSNIVTGKYSMDFLAYDFLINSAQGENTYPNMIPVLYGHNSSFHDDLIGGKGFSFRRKADDWIFQGIQQNSLWHFYKENGFVTMMGYDTIYDFLAKGLGKKIQTDHQAFNFWSGAAYTYGYKDFLELQQCLGLHNSHYYMLDYTWQYLNNYSKINKFAYIHLSTAHEESGTVIRTLDDDLVEYMEKLVKYFYDNPDEDMMIFVGSDHGKHTKEWDRSYEGYIENKLPSQFVITNRKFISRIDAARNLKENSLRMVGKFDWNLTLKQLAVSPYGKLDPKSILYNQWKKDFFVKDSISLLLESASQDRTCSDLGIENYLCTCIRWVDIAYKQQYKPVTVLADLAIKSINNQIKESHASCQLVHLDNILTAKEHQIRGEEFQNRNITITISIKESQKALYEVNGFAAEATKEFRRLELDDPYGFNPSERFTQRFPKGLLISMKAQLHSIKRLDIYSHNCTKPESLAAPYCFC
ncbi:unnamed protein product [Blepharisma stoltei]|uniref:Sulfatase N-terminal domain-containing protein n=1 Tax=Blepharisma stoltei TaxID=1481888 RepID=A0AAU9IYF3_9CILI|nr:unnamed protein product [Blepharisma stoltei]